MNGYSAMQAYQNTQAHSSVMDASPHKLISLLFDGAKTRLSSAKAAATAGNVQRRGELISKVIDIIASLQSYLDLEKGGEVASNLEALYDYMIRRLAQANRDNDPAIIDEVLGLISEIQTGWDGIAEAGI